MFYINYKEKRNTVTVNEFATKAEAEKKLDEMKTSLENADGQYETHEYYVSSRCSKAWKERDLSDACPSCDGEEEEEVENTELPEEPVTVDDQNPDDVYVDAYLETWETPSGKVREALVGNEDEEFIPTEEDEEPAIED